MPRCFVKPLCKDIVQELPIQSSRVRLPRMFFTWRGGAGDPRRQALRKALCKNALDKRVAHAILDDNFRLGPGQVSTERKRFRTDLQWLSEGNSRDAPQKRSAF